jgi:hypothetical protein
MLSKHLSSLKKKLTGIPVVSRNTMQHLRESLSSMPVWHIELGQTVGKWQKIWPSR